METQNQDFRCAWLIYWIIIVFSMLKRIRSSNPPISSVKITIDKYFRQMYWEIEGSINSVTQLFVIHANKLKKTQLLRRNKMSRQRHYASQVGPKSPNQSHYILNVLNRHHRYITPIAIAYLGWASRLAWFYANKICHFEAVKMKLEKWLEGFVQLEHWGW